MIFGDITDRYDRLPIDEVKVESDTVVAVIVDTIEPEGASAGAYPVVRHIFYGKTEAEARGYMNSHKKTDKFFAACFKGKMGDIECDNTKVTVKKVKRSDL